MAKKKLMYECLACGYESPKWLGKCPSCGAWNQMEEKPADIVAAEGKDQINVQTSKQRQEGSALKLDEIEYTQEDRMSTDFQEFDRVLGGGVVEGSLVLIGGDPGIGKSTLLLQVAMQLAQKQKILYVTILMRIAKSNRIAIFIVGHVTKEGNIAGPRMLEHMVDTVLYFEGEKHNRFRVLRAVKNRFGSTNELGVFEMLDVGLKEVGNPSQLFLEERIPGATGSTVVAALEGTRTILAEVQSLMTPTVYGTAKRTASGIDYQRISLLLAVMEKHCGLLVQNQDAFFKITGGIKLDEPAIDLAIAMSIASSYWNKPTQVDDCYIGEIGLTGEIRRVSQIAERLKETAKLGFKRVFIPKNNYQDLKDVFDIEIVPVKTIQEAVRKVFPR